MKHPSCRNERGSITVFSIGAVVIGITFLLVVANIGNIWLKKDLAKDSAEMLAPLILANQVSYRKLHNPDSVALSKTLADEAQLKQGFGAPSTITYQFGTANDAGTVFTPLNIQDPDPSISSQYFNAVAVQVETTPTNLGNLFGLVFSPLSGKGQAIAKIDATNLTCFCNAYCGSLSWFLGPACYTICGMFTMMEMMFDLMTLQFQAFLDALACLFQSMVLMAVSAWNWAFTAASVVINL